MQNLTGQQIKIYGKTYPSKSHLKLKGEANIVVEFDEFNRLFFQTVSDPQMTFYPEAGDIIVDDEIVIYMYGSKYQHQGRVFTCTHSNFLNFHPLLSGPESSIELEKEDTEEDGRYDEF